MGETPLELIVRTFSEAIWATIVARYGVEKTGNDFWEWILDHPEIPVLITEGEKKSFSGLGAGYAVLSLPGIDCGYTSSSENDDGSGSQLHLIPDLEALANDGRTIYIAFDRDSNPQTVKRVQKARQKLARLFAENGCDTLSIKWGEQFKGLDDFIFGAGNDAFDKAIESAQSLTPKIEQEGEQKETIPSALDMSKKVFKDLFENVIRFDASIKQYWRYDGRGMWVTCSNEYIFCNVRKYLEETIPNFSPSYVRNVIEFALGKFYMRAGLRLLVCFTSHSLMESWRLKRGDYCHIHQTTVSLGSSPAPTPRPPQTGNRLKAFSILYA